MCGKSSYTFVRTIVPDLHGFVVRTTENKVVLDAYGVDLALIFGLVGHLLSLDIPFLDDCIASRAVQGTLVQN